MRMCTNTATHSICTYTHSDHTCVQWLGVKIIKMSRQNLILSCVINQSSGVFFSHKAATGQDLLLYPLSQTHLKNKHIHKKVLEKCSNVNSVPLRLFFTSFWEKRKLKEWGEEGWRSYDIKLNGTTWMSSRIYWTVQSTKHFEDIKKPHLFLKERNWIAQYTNIMLSSNVLSDISIVLIFCKEFLRFHSSVTKSTDPCRRLRGTAAKLLLLVMSKDRRLKLSR